MNISLQEQYDSYDSYDSYDTYPTQDPAPTYQDDFNDLYSFDKVFTMSKEFL